ncbi:cytochrome c oxidase subunit 3 family protein [Bosea sp. 2YAB26]|uniref:cytochrome c oxidase subunit 3 family protein n=1 Tax=Bosea sp. 2YAB26 TaxID=3237478 RepID=UPI003F8E5970
MLQHHATAESTVREEPETDLLLWLLIWSELIIFAALLAGFAIANIADPAGFSVARQHLDLRLAGLATVVLLGSGLFAARAVQALRPARDLIIAAVGGFAFCAIKLAGYAREIPTMPDESRLFELYFLITGFHLAHVLFGALLLLGAAWWPRPRFVATIATVWHVIDLVWVTILPIVHLG